jgi:outer membrane protein OmpA-like peptidoglycan-associated protein
LIPDELVTSTTTDDNIKQPIATSTITSNQKTVDKPKEPNSSNQKTRDRIKSPELNSVVKISNLADSYEIGRKAIIHNIYFGFGTAGLSGEYATVLEELYQVLNGNPEIRVEIAGHTDNTGPQEVNQWLSENRAKAVRSWLINRGIDAKRLVAKGYGESLPLASNDDEIAGRELNRRIEVLIIK